MEERQEIDEVLEENKDIAHFSESSYVFTDISTSVCNRVRLMITEVLFLGESSFFCFVYQTHCYFDIGIAIPVKCRDQPQLSVLESPSYKSLGHIPGPRCARGV